MARSRIKFRSFDRKLKTESAFSYYAGKDTGFGRGNYRSPLRPGPGREAARHASTERIFFPDRLPGQCRASGFR